MRWRFLLIGILSVTLFGSAVAVVWSTQETRSLFVLLDRQQSKHDALAVEWGRLELEQSVWGAPERIARIAHRKMDMIMPTPKQIVFVKP